MRKMPVKKHLIWVDVRGFQVGNVCYSEINSDFQRARFKFLSGLFQKLYIVIT